MKGFLGASAIVLLVTVLAGRTCVADVSVTVSYLLDSMGRLPALAVDAHGRLPLQQRLLYPLNVTLPGVYESCQPTILDDKAPAYMKLVQETNYSALQFDWGLLSVCNGYTCSGKATGGVQPKSTAARVLCPPLLIERPAGNERLKVVGNGTFTVLAVINPWNGVFAHPFTLYQGDSISLHCAVFGYPPPQIRWHINGKIFEEDGNVNATVRSDGDPRVVNATLTITKFARADRGEYRCEASNSENGTVCSKVFTLRYTGRFNWIWPLLGILLECAVLGIVVVLCERRAAKLAKTHQKG